MTTSCIYINICIYQYLQKNAMFVCIYNCIFINNILTHWKHQNVRDNYSMINLQYTCYKKNLCNLTNKDHPQSLPLSLPEHPDTVDHCCPNPQSTSATRGLSCETPIADLLEVDASWWTDREINSSYLMQFVGSGDHVIYIYIYICI